MEKKILVSRSDFNKIDESELYLVDLLGFRVFLENGNKLGDIIDTLVMPTQNLIVVQSKAKEYFIPYVDEHIKFFDKKNKSIIIYDVEGLID